MKVLWLTHTASGASKALNVDDPGRGWIGSLEAHVKKIANVDLAIAFFNNQPEFKFALDNVTYYPIPFKYTSLRGKIVQRLFSNLYDSNVEALKKVIADFQPDVIHLFGTESGIGEVVKFTKIPVVVHLQGLVNPYLYSWLPKGVSQRDIWKHSSLRAVLLRRGTYFEYKLFQKRAVREQEMIRYAKYYFGRTEWDRNFIKLHQPECVYIHCEEVLRPVFYRSAWTAPQKGLFKMVTIINPQIYKGIEIILETASILKRISGLAFQWSVIGLAPDNEIVKLIEGITRKKFSDNHVSFKGSKVEDALLEEISTANVFVHPSHIDNSPNSICEAMLLGMPVIAGYVGGIPSLISDKVNGILYNSNDPYDLAGKIINLQEQPALLEKLGSEARKVGMKRHDVETIVSTVFATYQSMIENETPVSRDFIKQV
ncbi:glycosyltransferase family 4 protein [Arcticibacter sp.]|jgi:glycosyltransferase involved in cell wall biosynthesis|uniref:glycosyltransferase family 4 protein n=1 Tax=Arcticibacter sp. TaxID=1872630 RepID=UPI00388EF7BF